MPPPLPWIRPCYCYINCHSCSRSSVILFPTECNHHITTGIMLLSKHEHRNHHSIGPGSGFLLHGASPIGLESGRVGPRGQRGRQHLSDTKLRRPAVNESAESDRVQDHRSWVTDLTMTGRSRWTRPEQVKTSPS